MVERFPHVQVPWAKVRDLERRLQLVEAKVGSGNSLYINTPIAKLIEVADVTASALNRFGRTRGLIVPSYIATYVQALGELFGKKIFVAKALADFATDISATAPLLRPNTLGLVFPKAGIYNMSGIMRYLATLNAFDRNTCGFDALRTPTMSMWSVCKAHYTSLPTGSEFLNATFTPLLDHYPNWWTDGSQYGQSVTDTGGSPTNYFPLAPVDALPNTWLVNHVAQEYNGEHTLEVASDATASGDGYNAYAVVMTFWDVNAVQGTNVLDRVNLMTSQYQAQLALDFNELVGALGTVSRWDGVELPSIL